MPKSAVTRFSRALSIGALLMTPLVSFSASVDAKPRAPIAEFVGTGGAMALCAEGTRILIPLDKTIEGVYRGTAEVRENALFDLSIEIDAENRVTARMNVIALQNAALGSGPVIREKGETEWYYGDLSMRGVAEGASCTGRISVFIPAILTTPAPPKQLGRTGSTANERDGWRLASAIDTPQAYLDFLLKYPNGSFSSRAHAAFERAGGLKSALEGASGTFIPTGKAAPKGEIPGERHPEPEQQLAATRPAPIEAQTETAITPQTPPFMTKILRAWSLTARIDKASVGMGVQLCRTGMGLKGAIIQVGDNVSGQILDEDSVEYSIRGTVKGTAVTFIHVNQIRFHGSLRGQQGSGKIFPLSTWAGSCHGTFDLKIINPQTIPESTRLALLAPFERQGEDATQGPRAEDP